MLFLIFINFLLFIFSIILLYNKLKIMSWIKDEVSILVNSNPETGNNNATDDGSFFSVRL